MSLSGHRSVFTHHSAGLDYAGRHSHHPCDLPLVDIEPVAMVAAERAHRDHHLVELTIVKVGNLEQRAVGVDADHTELGLVVHSLVFLLFSQSLTLHQPHKGFGVFGQSPAASYPCARSIAFAVSW